MSFELHVNVAAPGGPTPFLLNIQRDLCRLLDTRIVVPVVREKPTRAETDLVVPINVGDETYYAVISHLGAVPVAVLGAVVADCAAAYQVIRDSVDKLFAGY